MYDNIQGCLVGFAIGECMGAPFQGCTAVQVAQLAPPGPIGLRPVDANSLTTTVLLAMEGEDSAMAVLPRAVGVGLRHPKDLHRTGTVAAIVTPSTPQMVSTSVAVALTVAGLVAHPDVSVDNLIQCVSKAVAPIDPEAAKWIQEAQPLHRLALDGESAAWKSVGAAFWALRQWQDLAEELSDTERTTYLLEAILRAGGDTRTNVALAGAFLGAVGGTLRLPPRLLNSLADRTKIAKAVHDLNLAG